MGWQSLQVPYLQPDAKINPPAKGTQRPTHLPTSLNYEDFTCSDLRRPLLVPVPFSQLFSLHIGTQFTNSKFMERMVKISTHLGQLDPDPGGQNDPQK